MLFQKYYQINSYRFAISTSIQDIAEELNLLFSPLTADPGPVETEFSIVQTSTDSETTYSLFEGKNLITKSDNIDKLLEELEWTATLRILENLSDFVQIHASGVVLDDGALLIPGPPGSGKTLLVLSFLLKGFSCLSDEIIFIHPQSLKAYPFPRSFHIEREAVNILPELKKYISSHPYLDSSGKVRLNPEAIRKNWLAEPAMPRWIIFPEYNQENSDQLIPIGKTHAISLLVNQAINLADYGAGGIDVLVDLVQKCDCYIFRAKSVHSSSVLVERLR